MWSGVTGPPHVDGITFDFGSSPQDALDGFRAGRYHLVWDLLPDDVERLRQDPQFASGYREVPRLGTYYIAFNVRRGPLMMELLRQELVRAIDVAKLVRGLAGHSAVPAAGLLPPGLLGAGISERARINTGPLTRAGTVMLSSTLNSVYEGPYASLAAELFAQVRAAGFNIQVGERRSEYFTNQAEALAEADVVLTRWIADFPDPDTFMSSLLHTERGIIGRLCGSIELDESIDRARSESDPTIRHDLYREIEQEIAVRALLMPLFHEQAYCFARPEVRDFEMSYLYSTASYRLWLA